MARGGREPGHPLYIKAHTRAAASQIDATWAGSIADGTQRDGAIESIARRWAQSDRPAAGAWLAQTSLAEDRKQRLLGGR